MDKYINNFMNPKDSPGSLLTEAMGEVNKIPGES